MFIHRCPWCDRKIFWVRSDMSSIFGRSKGVFIKERTLFCSKCRNTITKAPYHPSLKIIGILLLILGPIFLLLFSSFMKPVMIVPVILASLLFAPIPFLRGDKDGEIIEKKSKRVSANITWQPRKNKGLMKPRFQVLNHEIFPAFFFREDSLLNGDGICVSLQEICWSSPHECSCKIQLVLDDADDSFLITSDYFYLYHGKRRIAKGQIT